MKKKGFKIKVTPKGNLPYNLQFELHDLLLRKCEQGKMRNDTKKDNDTYYFFVYSRITKKDRTDDEFISLAFKDNKFYNKIKDYALIQLI